MNLQQTNKQTKKARNHSTLGIFGEEEKNSLRVPIIIIVTNEN
jgi:hypothetical protein